MWQKVGFINLLLVPFMLLYLFVSRLLQNNKAVQLDAFCICVGNVVVGGSGKTPFVMELAKKLKGLGYEVAIISKGYGSSAYKSKEVIKVDASKHTVEDVGDEPLMMCEVADVFVSGNRVESAKQAIEQGAKILVFDDGLQDGSFYKDYSFLLINTQYGFGNRMLLPAGPLRESLANAFYKADSVVFTGNSPATKKLSGIEYDIFAKTETALPNVGSDKVIAFCGIANPESFFSSLKQENITIVEAIKFPDHHNFTTQELDDLLKRAKEQNACLICTKKDWVRLPVPTREKVLFLGYSMNFYVPEKLKENINKFFGK